MRPGLLLALIFAATSDATAQAMPDTTVIPLAEAVQMARVRNASVQRARLAEAQQGLAIRAARASREPSFSLSTNAGRSFGRTLIENRIASGTADNVGITVSSDITVYDGGAARLQGKQGRYGLAAAEAQRTRTEQTVVYQVVNGYVNLAAQRENASRLREQVAAAEQQLARVNELIRERVRAEADRFAQEAEVAAARLRVASAERDVAVAEANLIGLLDLDPAASYDFQAPAIAALDSAAAVQAVGETAELVALAHARRPDVQALEANVRAAETGIRLARTGRQPQIGASFSYGSNWSSEYQHYNVDSATGQPVASDVGFFRQLDERRGGSFGLGLRLPIFDRQNTALAVERARVALDDATLAVAEQRQRINGEIAQALADLRAAPAQIGAAEAQVRAARRALEATEDRYRFASGTLYDVVQARATFVRAEGDLLQARATFAAQRAALAYTLGTLDPETLGR
ncbi:MAG: TolC family protein [Bacteroidetes bacterium]|nr:TolC family protein [Bacteroidota bacterium]